MKHLYAYMLRRVCRFLPPSFAYRLQFAVYKNLLTDMDFTEKVLFGKGRIRGNMMDAVDANFAMHGTANMLGMVVASFFLKKGDIVFELGANIGTETIALANLVGRKGTVVAVEAEKGNAEILQQRILMNKKNQVLCINKAISDSESPVYVVKGPENNRGMSFIEKERTIDSHSELIDSITVDLLYRRHGAPRVMLMDMEGAEVLGLIGGRQLLREKRPILFFELDVNHMERFGYSLHNLSEILKNSNYRIFDVMSWRLNELDINLLSADTHIDCLALPNELDNEREIAGIRIALIRGRLLPKLKYLSPLWF